MFKSRFEEFVKINEEKKAGIFRYVPLKDSFPKLTKYVAGIIPETSYIVTSSTGAGKSKFVRYFFIKAAYESIKNNKYNIDYKVIINGLEESDNDIIDSFIIQRLYEQKGLRINRDILAGYSTDYISKEVIDSYQESLEYYNDLEKILHISNQNNPTGFYKEIREYAYQSGKFYDKDGKQIDPKPSKKGEKWKGYHKYVKNNPNEIILPIADHVTLFGKEKSMSLYDTIAMFSKHYVRQGFNLRFKMPSVIVQQQNAESTNKQFSNNGKLVIDKLAPTLENLDSVKITKNDALVIFGMFAPSRFGVQDREGYDLNVLGDCYRELHILKNRKGGGIGKILPLFFDGLTEKFEELPAPDKVTLMKKYIEIANKIL